MHFCTLLLICFIDSFHCILSIPIYLFLHFYALYFINPFHYIIPLFQYTYSCGLCYANLFKLLFYCILFMPVCIQIVFYMSIYWSIQYVSKLCFACPYANIYSMHPNYASRTHMLIYTVCIQIVFHMPIFWSIKCTFKLYFTCPYIDLYNMHLNCVSRAHILIYTICI